MYVFLDLIVEADSLLLKVQYKIFVIAHLFGEVEGESVILEIGPHSFAFVEYLGIGSINVYFCIDINLFLFANRAYFLCR